MSCCSYCRITGKARNQPKASYPPLIPMPKPDVEELRRKFCRITAGKMEKHKYLPPIDPEAKNAPKAKRSRKMIPHKYAPAVEPKDRSRDGCKITKHEDPDYSPLYSLIAAEHIKELSESQLRSLQCSITHTHHFTPNYRYVYPIVDDKSKKILKKMKPEKEQTTILPVLPGYNYVYPVFAEECGVILSSELEETLRSGEIENIMLAKDRSEMIIETLEGGMVTLQTKELTSEQIHEEIAEENLMPGFGGGKNFVLADENEDEEENSECDHSETGNKAKPKLSKLKRHYTLDLSDVQRSPPIDGPMLDARKNSLPDATKLEKSKKKPKLEAFTATIEENSGPVHLSFLERALQMQQAKMGGTLTFLGGPDWDEIRAAKEGFDFSFLEEENQEEETDTNFPASAQMSSCPLQTCTPAISSSEVVIRCQPNQVAIPLLDDAVLEEAQDLEGGAIKRVEASEEGPSPFPLMRSKKSSLHLNMDMQKRPNQRSASISSEPVDMDEGVEFCPASFSNLENDDVISSLIPDDFTSLDILNVSHLGMENCGFENGIQSFESILQPGFIALTDEVTHSELHQNKKKLKTIITSQKSQKLVNGELNEKETILESNSKENRTNENREFQEFMKIQEAKRSANLGQLSEIDKTSNESVWKQEAKLVADFLQDDEVNKLESFDESVKAKLQKGKHHLQEILQSENSKFTDFLKIIDELSLDRNQETIVKAAISEILDLRGRFEESEALKKTCDYSATDNTPKTKNNLKQVTVGQIQTKDGLCEVTMQQIELRDGQRVLAMGEVKTKEGSKMVALGQIHTKDGARAVALGQIQTSDGPKMVALGQIRTNEGSKLVALGHIEAGDGMKLIAMEQIETNEGTKMVAIQQIQSEDLDSSVDLCDVPKILSVLTKEGPRLANVGQIQTSQGTKTVALGKIHTKNGAKTVALGQIQTEYGAKTVALGQINTSEGTKTMALGQIQTSEGPRMVALGQIQTPQGPKLVALAEIQTDEGPKMMAIGHIQTPDGPKLIALGHMQTNEGTKMVAIREIKPSELPQMGECNLDKNSQMIPSVPLPEMPSTDTQYKASENLQQRRNSEHKVVFVLPQKGGNQEVILSTTEMQFLQQQNEGSINLSKESLQHLIEEGMIQSQGNGLFLTEKGIKIQQYLAQNNQKIIENEQEITETGSSKSVAEDISEVIVMSQDGSVLKKRKVSNFSLNCTNQAIVVDDSGKEMVVRCLEGTVTLNGNKAGEKALNIILAKNGKELSIPSGETIILNQRKETGELEQIVLSNINGELVHQPQYEISNQVSSQQSKMIAIDGKHILVQEQNGQIITKTDENGILQTCVLDRDGKEVFLANGQAMIIQQVNEMQTDKVLVLNQDGKIIVQKQINNTNNSSVDGLVNQQQKVVVEQKGQALLVEQCEGQVIKKINKKNKTTEISVIGKDGKEICIPVGQALVVETLNENGELEKVLIKNESGKIIQEKNCPIHDLPDTSPQQVIVTNKAGQEILVQKCEGSINCIKNKSGKTTNLSVVGKDGKEIAIPIGKGIVVNQTDEKGEIHEVYIVNKGGKLVQQETSAIKPLVGMEKNPIGNWEYVDLETTSLPHQQQQNVLVKQEGEILVVKQCEGLIVQKTDKLKNTVELSVIGKDGQEICIPTGQGMVLNQINDKGEIEQIFIKNENGKIIQDKKCEITDLSDTSSQKVVVANQEGKEVLVQKCEGKIISTRDKSGTITDISVIGEDGKEVIIPIGKGVVVSQTNKEGEIHEVYIVNNGGKLIQSDSCLIKQLSSYESLQRTTQDEMMEDIQCVEINCIPEVSSKQQKQHQETVVIQEKGQNLLVQQCEGQIITKTDNKSKTLEICIIGKDGRKISIAEGQGMVLTQINNKGEKEQILVKKENGKLIQEKNCIISELPKSSSQHAVILNEEGCEILIEKCDGKIINKTNKRGKVVQTCLLGHDGKEIVIPEGKGVLVNQRDENGEVQEIYVVNENGKLKQPKNYTIKSLPTAVAQQPQISNEKELPILIYEGKIINRINSSTQAQELVVIGKDGKEIAVPPGQRIIVNNLNSDGQKEFVSLINENGSLIQQNSSISAVNNVQMQSQAIITENEQSKIVPQVEGKIIQKLSRKGSVVNFYAIDSDGLEIPIPEGQGIVLKQISKSGEEQLVYVCNDNGKLVQKNEMITINSLERVNQQNSLVSQSGKNLIIQSCEGRIVHKYDELGEILETKVIGKDGKEVPIALGQGIIVNQVNDKGQIEQAYIVNQDGKETVIPVKGKDNKRSNRVENLNHPQQQLIVKQNGKPAVIQGTVIERVNLKGQKELMFVVNQDGRQVVLSEHQVIGIVQQATCSCSAKLVDTDSLNVVKLKDSSEIIKRNPVVILKAFAELDLKLPVNGEIDAAVINKEKNGNIIQTQLVLGQFNQTEAGVEFLLGRVVQTEDGFMFEVLPTEVAALPETYVTALQSLDVGSGKKLVIAKLNMEIITHGKNGIIQESSSTSKNFKIEESVNNETVDAENKKNINTGAIPKRRKSTQNENENQSTKKARSDTDCNDSNLLNNEATFVNDNNHDGEPAISSILHTVIPRDSFLLTENAIDMISGVVLEAAARGEIRVEELEKLVNEEIVNLLSQENRYQIRKCQRMDFLLNVDEYIAEREKISENCAHLLDAKPGWLSTKDAPWKISTVPCHSLSGILKRVEIGEIKEMDKMVVEFDLPILRRRQKIFRGIRVPPPKDPNNLVFDLYVAIADYIPDNNDTEAVPLAEGQIVEVLDSNSSQRWLVRTRPTKTAPGKQGWVPPSYLEKKTLSSTLKSIQDILEMEVESKMDVKEKEADRKRAQVVKELVEAEEEFSKDMQQVVNTYLKDFDSAKTPKEIRDLRESIFMNFKQICDFHTNVLIKGVQYYAAEPLKLGKTFLRLERDFDMHVRYCRDEPQAQEVLAVSPAKEFFEEYSKRIGEVDKSLRDHLKLPIQRINDYQLLLKELIKYSARLKEDCTDLQKALDLMLSIPQRAHDLKFINSIQGYRGNLFSLGRVLRHDWFTVSDSEAKSKERYLFLFKSRVLITKVRKISEEKSVFILKDIIRLPDVEVRESPTDKCKIELHHKQKGFPRYPLSLIAKTEFIREAWVKELKDHLAELAGIIDLGIDEIEVEPEKSKAETADESETYEELNTVMTESLRSGSMTSTEAKKDKKPSPPRFTKPLRPPKALKPGDNLTLECEVTAIPPATVSWLKNNIPLSESDRFKFVSKGNVHCLTVKGVQIHDEGLYTAKASNASGSAANSAVVCLEVPKEDERPATPGGTPIPHKATFPISLKDTELLEGTSVTFMIKVRAHPEAQVKFFKDGKDLKQDDRLKIVAEDKETFELIITNVTKADAGKYSCKATNSQGESSCEAQLKVTDEKKLFEGQFEEAKKKGVIKPGEEPDFKWFRDGQEFEASERFKVMFGDEEDTVALVFRHVKPEDAGLYTCVASTSSGRISCSAELTVQGAVSRLAKEPGAPKFVTELQDTEASAGGSAMLELRVSGFPKPNIIWQKDGQEVKAGGRLRFLHEDEESIALVIKQVTKEDSGKYKVTAKNELGQVTTTANLVVKAPPAFKKQLTDISAMMSEDIRIEVEIEGNPAPEVIWYKDGQQVVQSDRIKIVHEKGEIFALVIKKAAGEDAGSYNCVATNSGGKTSEFANLTVNVPAGFAKELKTTEIKETETVKLEAKVVGSPIPKAKWLKDGQELKADGKHIKIEQDERNHSVTIDKAVRKDAGKFTIELTNEFGTSSSSGDLIINCIPEFSAKLGDVTIKEGDQDVKFEVKLSGTPTPKIKWFIESMEITEKSNNFKVVNDGETQALIIKNVEESCSGKITCQATNTMGDVKSSAVINVLTKPKFTQSVTDKEVTEGDTVKYTVTVHSNPPSEVKWYKNNQEVTVDAKVKITKESSETWSLTLDCVSAATAGDYECRAKNSEGESITKSKLIVNTKPTFDKGIQDQDIWLGLEAILEVKVQGIPYPEVKWIKDDKPIAFNDRVKSDKKDNVHILQITQTKVEDGGDYRCEIKNKIGEDVTKAKLTIKTPADANEPAITKPLSNVMSVRYSPAVFEARILGNPKPMVNWFKDGKPLQMDERIVASEVKDDFLYRLTINKCVVEDMGKYKITAENESDTISTEAELDVKVPPEITISMDRKIMPKGQATFEAKVTGLPQPKVSWCRNGKELVSGPIFKWTADDKKQIYVLNVDGADVEDGGEYQCVGENMVGKATQPFNLLITTDLPKFTKVIEDILVKPTKPCQFDVEVDGIPMPHVKWFFKGTEIKESDKFKFVQHDERNHSLVITPMLESDVGEYTCKAISKAGENSCSAKIGVKHDMPFYPKHVPKEVCAIDGEDFTVEAIVDGSPQPTIKWLKDGKEVVPSDRVIMEYFPDTGVARLTVKGAKTEDIGKYTLIATNATGELSSTGVVKVEVVPKPPSFIEKLKKTDVVQGAPMQLCARVTGHPKPSIKWFKDGKPIRPTDPNFRTAEKPDGCIALIIDDAKPEDAGKYGLQVRNSLGESLSEAEVTVKSAPEAPEFLLKPKHTDVFEGFSIKLDGRVKGFPTPTLKWLKDGKEFTPDGERVIASYKPEDGTYALIINKCKTDDTAKYTCVATNSLGENTAVVDLGVRGRTKGGEALCAPSFVTSLSDINIDEGGPIRMTATIAGNPIPDIKWTKDGEPISSTDKMNINFDGQRVILEIKKGYPKDVGKYECTLSNVEGSTSSISNVEVKKLSKAPVFTQRFPDVNAVLGQDVQFVCRAVGLPDPEAIWYFSDKQLQDSDKYRTKHEGDMFALFIKNCQLPDIGNVTCKIKNSDGEDKCVAFLNVTDTREVKPMTESPSFLKKLADCDVIEGMLAKFTACISGLPEPEFKWYKDGRELVPTNRIKFEVEPHGLLRLLIKPVSKDDIGKYSLKITNSLGSDECSASLNCESSKLPPHLRVKVELPRSRYAYSSSRKLTTRW